MILYLPAFSNHIYLLIMVYIIEFLVKYSVINLRNEIIYQPGAGRYKIN